MVEHDCFCQASNQHSIDGKPGHRDLLPYLVSPCQTRAETRAMLRRLQSWRKLKNFIPWVIEKEEEQRETTLLQRRNFLQRSQKACKGINLHFWIKMEELGRNFPASCIWMRQCGSQWQSCYREEKVTEFGLYRCTTAREERNAMASFEWDGMKKKSYGDTEEK